MPASELAVAGVLFFTAATIYSSVGFGGGSAYLALLTFLDLPIEHIAVVALSCNIIVAGTAARRFTRGGHFESKLVLATVPLSIVAAFIGGLLVLDAPLLRLLTGLALAAASLATFARGRDRVPAGHLHGIRAVVASLLAAGLGLLAGVIGIGGGVFLAPFLLLSGWGSPKQVATIAGIFTLCNSAAALFGKIAATGLEGLDQRLVVLLLAVALGAQIGSRLGADYLSPHVVARFTALLIGIAAVNLLLRA